MMRRRSCASTQEARAVLEPADDFDSLQLKALICPSYDLI
jgi:hypothetical protein